MTHRMHFNKHIHYFVFHYANPATAAWIVSSSVLFIANNLKYI